MPTSKQVANFVINKVPTKAIFNKMKEQGLINDDEIYLVEEDDSSSPFVSYESQTLTTAQKTQARTNIGALSTTGNAASATKLATARTIRTNLASTSTASFNGTSNITPGVTGVLPVTNGGTGQSTNSNFHASNHSTSDSSMSVTSYPTKTGIYRTIGTNIFGSGFVGGLHGNLIITKVNGYTCHHYTDENGNLYITREDDSGLSGFNTSKPAVSGWKRCVELTGYGQSGNWYYQIYSNGYAECWGSFSVNQSSLTQWGSMYITTKVVDNYPVTFTASPNVQVSVLVDSQVGCWVASYSNVQTSIKNPGTLALCRPSNTAISATLKVYVRGKTT